MHPQQLLVHCWVVVGGVLRLEWCWWAWLEEEEEGAEMAVDQTLCL
jgi:hypothetical protein